MAILVFLVLHWYLAAFCQTVFLHRYSSHSMFTMSKRGEKFFYFLTFFCQGSSYLNPRAYAVMHRMHHAHSDTALDPHSPRYFDNPMKMMWNTFHTYIAIQTRKLKPEARFEGGYPEWPAFDRWADSIPVRLGWIALYVLFYVRFADAWWQYLFLPVHVFMGPVHGAIVNWCGHKYGYANHDNRDRSRNTFCADLLTMGELMQNNHHHDTQRPNFANRWFELDPTYPLLRLLAAAGVIRLQPVKTSMESNLFAEWNRLGAEPWMRATLVDFYFNITILTVWLFYRETCRVRAALWTAAFVILGSIATAFYVFLQIHRLKPGEPLKNAILRA
jgi:stearoyl-CoA desaturase (Delta-9 desaturase)